MEATNGGEPMDVGPVYSKGDLLEACEADALDAWRFDMCRSYSMRAAKEKFLRCIETSIIEHLGGQCTVQVRIECKPNIKSESYYWPAGRIEEGLYRLVGVSVI